jgi:competence protein ComFC
MIFDFFTDAFFPRRCVRCRAAVGSGVLCGGCRAKIALHSSLFCGKCRARLPEAEKICHKDFPYILGAAGAYRDETMRMLIHRLKFKGIRDAAAPLAEIMAGYVSKLALSPADYVAVPIPLSERRRRERGFNQSELIAMALARRLGMPLETAALVRMRHSSPQSLSASVAERKENVKGCFAAANGSLRSENIILIDDVTTSGATFLEAARTMKAAGAKKIIALAAAMA